MSDSHTSNENDDKYFTFANPTVQHSLHVVDADYGAFESQLPRGRTNNLKLRTPKFLKRFKDKSLFDEREKVILDNEDDLKLRAEPEIANINYISDKRSIKSKFVPIPNLTPESEDDDLSDNDVLSISTSGSSSNNINDAKIYQPLPILENQKYDRSQNEKKNSNLKNESSPSSSSSSSFKKENKSLNSYKKFKKNSNNSITPSLQSKLQIDENYKSKIELEYEKLKFKAARYQTERDMLKVKIQHQKMAFKLREYEYFCVNGIDHKSIENDSNLNTTYKSNIENYQTGNNVFLQSQSQSQQRQKGLKNTNNQTSKSRNSNMMETNFFDKLSTNMPPEVVEYFQYYADYVPSIKTIREFHQAVLEWVYTIPFLSIIYPILKLLGIIIPKNSKRTWSFRALLVGFLDSIILLLTGWIVYNFIKFTVTFIISFLKVARLLGIA